MKMKGPLKFYKSGSPSHVRPDPTSSSTSTAELLKWISDVTIKRRSIRRSTHCSNLFAEAILSSALRKAKKDLASKQEEKRRKLRLFCSERFDEIEEGIMEASQTEENEDNEDQISVTVNSYVYSSDKSRENDNESSKSNSSRDEEVSACLSSLESFFNELKSVKVSSSS